ncbi:MAG: glycosyltransferase family 2 protein [Saprospiraceae bacterium]|nr:glycosyltransferase family 2 protein [Saprospiraceae bacterium]
MLKILFFALIGIIFYAYLGYGIVLYILLMLKKLFGRKTPPLHIDIKNLPAITFIIPSFNEEEFILPKIENTLQLQYPKDKFYLLFVTDGSNDNTNNLIQQYPFEKDIRYSLEFQPERKGKIAAVERVMPTITSPIVIFTDANTMINETALYNIVRHYSNPKVGAVAGEKRIAHENSATANAAGEGIYWKYESLLKKWDSAFNTVVGAAGELFSIRTELYQPVEKDTLVEDFVMTMRIAQRGYKVVYEPEAFAVEGHSANMEEEMKRKVRIAAGGLQAVYRLSPILNIFKYGWLSFQYISHRVLRWTIAPIALPILFVLNFYLYKTELNPIYKWLMLAQIVFYAFAVIGYFLEQRKLKIKAFFIPYYFCMMNWAVYRGFFRLIKGNQSVVWEKAKRA